MKHIKYSILTLIITFFSIIGKSQIIISADSFSCEFFLEKNGIKDNFLISLKPLSGDLVKKNKDTNLYKIETFKVKLAKILSFETANVLDNFYSLDSAKLLGIKGSIKGNTTFLYSIKQLTSSPLPLPLPPPPPPQPFWESINKKWFLFFLIFPLILILIFRKKIGSILIAKDKKVAPPTEFHYENDAAPVADKVHVIHNNEMDTNNISESDLKKENKSSEKEIKELTKQNNEHVNKIIKKNEDEIDRLKKSIKIKDESIKNHETALAAKLAEQKEQYENKLSTLKNDHENTLNKYKQDVNNQNKKHEEKLLAIVAENKQLDKVVSKIYEKYQFLNDERKYDNSFDLGQIIEASYFFNSATKNYLLKLPVLFNMEFKSQGILSKSDKANLDYLLTSNIADNVLVADEDSVKRNQDLSKFITDLRKKLVEAKVKDVSNVIIENHRIKL
jgi:hypothetical protein